MTTYGTIPSQSNSSNLGLFGRAKEVISLLLGSKRQWLELVQYNAFSFPISYSLAIERLKANILIFRNNYFIILFVTILISLLWYPGHLFVFLILMLSWLYVYSRDNEPLVICGRVIEDSSLVMVLLVFTICLFLFTDISHGFLIGVFAGLPVVLVHGACRNIEMVFVLEDDEEKTTMNVNVASSSSSVSSSS